MVELLYDWYWEDADGNVVAHTDLDFRETVFTDLMNRYNEEKWAEIDDFGVISPIVGFDFIIIKTTFGFMLMQTIYRLIITMSKEMKTLVI